MKSSSKILIVIVLVVIAVGVVTFLNRLQRGRGELVKAVKRSRTPVHTLVLRPLDLAETVSHTGTLQADQDVLLTPEVAGKVIRVHKRLGDTCRRGEVLLQLDRESYQIALLDATAAQKQSAAQLKQARRELARAQKLRKRAVVTGELAERAETAVLTAEALAGRADATTRMARRNLRKTTVRCPFDGVVAQRLAQAGQTVAMSSPLARVVDSSHLKLQIQVSAADLARIKLGQQVSMADPSRPSLGCKGKVARLGVAADPVTHTFPVEVVVDPQDTTRVRAGQLVRASIRVALHRAVLAVPADAVTRSDQGVLVHLVRGRAARRQSVKLGPEVGRRVIVLDGLRAGDEVIVEGQVGLKQGAPVEPVQQAGPTSATSMGQTPGSKKTAAGD